MRPIHLALVLTAALCGCSQSPQAGIVARGQIVKACHGYWSAVLRDPRDGAIYAWRDGAGLLTSDLRRLAPDAEPKDVC